MSMLIYLPERGSSCDEKSTFVQLTYSVVFNCVTITNWKNDQRIYKFKWIVQNQENKIQRIPFDMLYGFIELF